MADGVPLRRSRRGQSGTAHEAVSHPEDRQTAIQQQRRAFELELSINNVNDPLDVWDRYVRWTLQTYPQGGECTAILERAVQQFVDERCYYDDTRYVNFWIKLAQHSKDPDTIYSYMKTQGIGVTQAGFYKVWAEEHEKSGNLQRADAIFQDGLTSGAQPVDELQQLHRAFQARVSAQAAPRGGVQAGQEEDLPPRVCQVNMRPRGKKKARSEAVVGHVRSLNLQLPTRATRSASSPLTIFTEGQTGSSVAPMPQAASSSSWAKEKQIMPSIRKLTDGMEMELEEVGGAEVENMYCKEYSTEEQRADLYFAAIRRQMDAKSKELMRMKEELRLQIEEKERMVQMKKSQHLQQPPASGLTEVGLGVTGSSVSIGQPPSMPFQIYDESQSVTQSGSWKSNPCQNDITGDFLLPGEPASKRAALSDRNQMSKNILDGTESMNEAVVHGYNSKTLCASPEDTNAFDFACATKMVSTPAHQRRNMPNMGEELRKDLRGMAGNTSAVTSPTETGMDTGKKLSPIVEASMEASSDSALQCSGLQPGQKAAVGRLSRLEESCADMEAADQTSHVQSPPEDPCSLSARRKLWDEVDLSTFPNLHSEAGPLPTVEEGSVLLLGNETVLVISQIADCENFSVYSGKWDDGDCVLKVDRSTVPWDLYISSRLRLATELTTPDHEPGHYFLFQDGCVTLQRRQPCTLQDFRKRVTVSPSLSAHGSLEEENVAQLALEMVELVRRMHSCGLVHGALRPDTRWSSSDAAEAALAVDFSCAVDLEQQRVTSAQQLQKVDLVGIGETVRTLLANNSLKHGSEWTMEGSCGARHRKEFWSKFFKTLLNPGDQSSLSVLTELSKSLTLTFD